MSYPISVPYIIAFRSDSEEAWKRIQQTVISLGSDLSDWAVNLLRSGLEPFIRCAVFEPRYVCKDHANMHHHFYSKKFVQRSAQSARLHFFSREDVDMQNLIYSSQDYQEFYLGYAVVRPVRERCIGRMIIDASKIRRGVANGYYAMTTKYKVRIFGPELEALGFPYLGSDGDAMLCGHSALWSICRYLSDRYTQYAELLPYDLIALTHKEHGRVLPDRGTDPRDYSPILSNIGAHPVVLRCNQNRAHRGVLDPAFHDVCTYIESGIPVLASFEGHAAALIGHTLDYQRPISLGEMEWFVDHSWFFDSLIECDGNLFPYARLTYDPHSDNRRAQKGQARRFFIEDINAAVCPLPEKVYLSAAMARNMALSVVQSRRGEIERYGQAPFVTRLFFTSSSAFKQRKLEAMRAQAGMESFPTFIAQLHLPHFIWIMEVAPYDSYCNHQCCAEVVIDSSAGRFDNGVIFARIGRNVYYAGDQREFTTCPEKLPIFTHNLGRAAP
jgi:hypothetical protein